MCFCRAIVFDKKILVNCCEAEVKVCKLFVYTQRIVSLSVCRIVWKKNWYHLKELENLSRDRLLFMTSVLFPSPLPRSLPPLPLSSLHFLLLLPPCSLQQSLTNPKLVLICLYPRMTLNSWSSCLLWFWLHLVSCGAADWTVSMLGKRPTGWDTSLGPRCDV